MADRTDIGARLVSVLPSRYRSLPGSQGLVIRLFITVGAVVVAAIATLVCVIGLLTGEPLSEALSHAGWATVGGLLFALFGAVMLPLIRDALGLTEDIRLLEAASPAHPLLRRLMTEAPGTYTHSVSVANLAEAAAEKIGADPLLARVAAYYHDVGKIRRPCFFYENQPEGQNPHDDAKPALSAVIITAHVSDGVSLAEEYRLPEKVVRIVSEHHGDSLVRYFFHKASQEDAGAYEADFRYQADKPSSREAALVMLADGCEASVRALSKPTEEQVETRVRRVFAEREGDGQLAGSGLRPDEIDVLVKVYTRMLTSMYHSRCDYPEHSPGRRPA